MNRNKARVSVGVVLAAAGAVVLVLGLAGCFFSDELDPGFDITYHKNDGSGYSKATRSTKLTDFSIFRRPGYTLIAWSDKASGGLHFGAGISPPHEAKITADTYVLYAIWVADTVELTSLTVSAGTLQPAFLSTVTNYTASVPFLTSSVTVTPTANATDATITVNGETVASGASSAAIPLTAGGTTDIVIVVTAAGGASTETYTITMARTGIPTDHLVGAWLFTGNADDASGNDHHGTVHGATATADRHGTAGAAYAFSGAGDYVEVAHASALNLAETSFAVSIWGRSALATQPWAGLLSKYHTATGLGYVMAAAPSPANQMYVGTNGAVCQTSTAVIGQAWHSYVWSYDSASHTSTLYVDGVASATSTATQNPNAANTDPLCFAVDYLTTGPARFWNGDLDDIRIYSRALTQDEVDAIAGD